MQQTFILGIISIFFLSSCSQDRPEGRDTTTGVTPVKYQGVVDVSTLDTVSFDGGGSSVISRVWYTHTTGEMTIEMVRGGLKYKYCHVTQSEYDAFRTASSLGTHYHRYFRDSRVDDPHDCRR